MNVKRWMSEPGFARGIAGWASAFLAAVALLYAADYVFLRRPLIKPVEWTWLLHESESFGEVSRHMYEKKHFLWFAVAGCVAVAFVRSIRYRERPATVFINVGVLGAAVTLVIFCRWAVLEYLSGAWFFLG